jgi:hypothetical protein
MQQIGFKVDDLILPLIFIKDQPPLPDEIDDEYIHRDQIFQQPPGQTSTLTAFVLGIKIYSAMSPVLRSDVINGENKVLPEGWDSHKRILEHTIVQVKELLRVIPRELQLNLTQTPQTSDQPGPHYQPPMTPYALTGSNGNSMQFDDSASAHRNTPFEIQKGNLYASQLATRSYLVEKYAIMQETHYRESKCFTV